MAATSHDLSFHPLVEFLTSYLAQTSLAHALFRGAEALALGTPSLSPPLLDLGCGSGEFAALALVGRVDVGLDLCGRRLAAARTTGKYARLVQADARRVPLSDRSFATIFSLSALEHFAEPDAVLAEVRRLLRPGGTFLGTLVLADLREHLFYTRLFRALGLHAPARWYVALHERCFDHRTLLTQDAWEELFRRHGLRLDVCRKIVPPSLTRWWDLLLPLALPGWLLGRRGSWRPRWLARLLARRLAPLLARQEKQGSVLLFVARTADESAPAPTPAAYSPGTSCDRRDEFSVAHASGS